MPESDRRQNAGVLPYLEHNALSHANTCNSYLVPIEITTRLFNITDTDRYV